MILAMLVSAYGALETLRLLFTLHVYKTGNMCCQVTSYVMKFFTINTLRACT